MNSFAPFLNNRLFDCGSGETFITREQARADAEAEVREMMSEAERQAAQATYHALEEASVQWEHKKEEARQRIPQAARWIVEKVVER